jgi:hypothetical protein
MLVVVTSTTGREGNFFAANVEQLKKAVFKKWGLPLHTILVEYENHILTDEQEFKKSASVTLALRIFENQDKPLQAASQWLKDHHGAYEVWAEDVKGACKRYIVATKDEIQYYLDHLAPEDRHLYEIIRGHLKCRLYLDIDGAGLTGIGSLLDDLKEFLVKFIGPKAQVEFRNLTSHREGVFSMHVIAVVTKNGEEWLWENAYQAGEVVHQFIAAFPRYKEAVDEGVYNMNRCFRLVMCCKKGKTFVLLGDSDRIAYYAVQPDGHQPILPPVMTLHGTLPRSAKEKRGLPRGEKRATKVPRTSTGRFTFIDYFQWVVDGHTEFPTGAPPLCRVEQEGVGLTLFREDATRCGILEQRGGGAHHKSNRAPIRFNLQRGACVQSCFDEECVGEITVDLPEEAHAHFELRVQFYYHTEDAEGTWNLPLIYDEWNEEQIQILGTMAQSNTAAKVVQEAWAEFQARD